jgi:excisionase family DNA binding protein
MYREKSANWQGRNKGPYIVIHISTAIEIYIDQLTPESPMPANAKSLLTIGQAAEELDKSPVTIRRYVQKGKLTHYRIGGEVRIDPAHIVALIAAGYRKGEVA